MYLPIADILTKAEIDAARAHIDGIESTFASGKLTAGHHAKSVKHNEQAAAEASAPVLTKVRDALLKHPVFKAAAQPQSIVKLMLSRYRPGMHYGSHVDEPFMEGKRTDLSFTLFLSPPETYDGGDLVIEETDGERAFKLEAGSVILYPSTTLHRVEDVTSGERLAVVGWIRSRLRDAGQREIIFDLENAIASLSAIQAPRAVLDRIYKTRANLIRMWAED
jgi:PKHD-type hydroxylase